MKKLFMFAAAAALALGAVSCAKNPGGENPTDGATGDNAGLKLSISFPAAQGNTRADDRDGVNAIASEIKLNSVDVYVFDENGDAPEVPTGVTVTPAGATYSHRRYVATDFDGGGTTATPAPYTMKDGQQMQTIAGEDMRIWVGINVPSVISAKEFDSEAELLDEIATIASMIGAAEGFTMFSNVTEAELLPTTNTPDNQYINELANPIKVNRVTSKIIATSPASFPEITWDPANAGAGATKLTYNTVGWYTMQYGIRSYVAPHYEVDIWNNADQSGYADTYKLMTTGVEARSEYDDLTSADMLKLVGSHTDSELADQDYVTGGFGRYIGENASTLQNGAPMAFNGNTTYAFISTGVTATAEAVWQNATSTLPNAIIWQDVVGGYGYKAGDTYYATPGANVSTSTSSDIYVINAYGDEYITSLQANADAIKQGLARQFNVDNSLGLNLGTTSVDNTIPEDGVEMSYTDFYLSTDPTEASYDPDHAGFDVNIFKYTKGAVHFMQWINGDGANDYNVLRNQFIDVNVTGMNPDLADGLDFPGYPGDPLDPKKPIDPTDDEDDSNPDPLDPEDPVDPTAASLMVDVEVNPWTYRSNPTVLGR
ncbi:MAG: Mfa1 family fimbria major subunit [Alistipes sp.]|jgi:hypothetical protein|nr:Mfa1 family fimbria major subunit [Alistipes sp.]